MTTVRPRTRSSRPQPTTSAAQTRRRHLPVLLAIVALACGTYIGSLRAGFVLDSTPLILDDARVHDASAANVGLILQHTYWWPRGESGLYRPLTTASYLFNYAVLGNADRPLGYHAVNIVLHAVNALLVYAIAFELLGAVLAAAAAAALWAVHPLGVEAVANIAGRADLLATLGTLAALVMYQRSTATSGGRAAAWRLGVFAAALAGAAAKESAAVVVALIPLYEWSRGGARTRWKPVAYGTAAAAIAVGLVLAQRASVLAASPSAEFPYTDNPIVGASFWSGRLTALAVVGRYLWLLAWPSRLSCDYSYAAIPIARGTLVDWLAWATVAGAVAAIAVWRRDRAIAFGGSLAALAVLPASNLLFAAGTIMGERLMYLPSAGLALAVVALTLAANRRHGRVGLAAVAVAVVACATRSAVRTADWRDDLTIWRSAEAAYPENYKAHKGVAGALAAVDPAHAAIATIVGEGERAVAILDPLPDAQNDPGAYRDAAGYHLVQSDVFAGQPGPAAHAESVGAAARAVPLLRRYVAIAAAGGGRALTGATAVAASRMMADGYRLMSIASTKADAPDAAVDAAAQARALDPLNPASYQQTAVALLAAHRPGDAAIWLAAGAVVTGNTGLRAALVSLYRQGLDADGCAVVAGTADVLNPGCPAVRDTMCAAATESIRIERANGRSDVADALRATTREQFKCDPGG